jgi:hypothetical protein
MEKRTTKYFGEVELTIDEDGSWADFDTVYNGQAITVSLSDYGIYEDKVKICWEIIDKYVEINEVAKKGIAENFPGNETINFYFECHFDILEEEKILKIFGIKTFDKFDINKTVKNLEYPNLLFGIDEGEITFSVDYMVSKEYSDEILCVKMNEKLEITDFSHES